jgi:membrane-associated protease RseP (regulator of RpoE activity)
MSSVPSVPGDAPTPEALAGAFHVYEVETGEGDDPAVRYYGEPLVDREAVVRQVAGAFRARGYTVSLRRELGEHVLVATERSPDEGFPTTNVLLFVATVGTTLLAGTQWYGIDVLANPRRGVDAWPFVVAVLGVLGVHELGHYVASRRHDVAASLPYFIPIPTLLGTLGAVIRTNDHFPDRDALFDVGVAGPLAGLAATVVVAAIGVTLPPVEASVPIRLGYPPLVIAIAALLGEPLTYGDGLVANPVVVGAWVGAFVTFLNLLPVGQLDGGHILRAVAGDATGKVALVVPPVMFGLAGYVWFFGDGQSVGVWGLYGLLTLLFARSSGVTPIDDSPLGRRRLAVAGLTVLLGVLSFTPTPLLAA